MTLLRRNRSTLRRHIDSDLVLPAADVLLADNLARLAYRLVVSIACAATPGAEPPPTVSRHQQLVIKPGMLIASSDPLTPLPSQSSRRRQ